MILASDADGRLDRAALPLLSAVRRSLGATHVRAVGHGPAFDPAWLGAFARAGADAADWTDGPPAPRGVAGTLSDALDRPPEADVALVPSTEFGREVAARTAARRGLGLVGDATDFGREVGGPIVFRKPAFGGQAIAEIVSRTEPPLATMRPGAFPPEHRPERAIPLRRSAAPPENRPAPTLLWRGEEPLLAYGSLDDARFVVTVGNGIGGPDGVERVRSLLSGSGWALAATRRVVDAGWVPRRLQVGLTGRSLSPEVVVLAGVRGSANHLVGWERARRIVAINPDPGAAVFERSDAGLVATWETALPPLVAALRAWSAER